MLYYPRINFYLRAVCKRFLERMAPLQRKARYNKSLKPMFAAAAGIKPGLAQYVRPQFQMTRKIKSFVTTLWIGLLAGTLDITDNLIFNQLRGITPKMVFQYIASGLIGLKAFQDGLESVVLG